MNTHNVLHIHLSYDKDFKVMKMPAWLEILTHKVPDPNTD